MPRGTLQVLLVNAKGLEDADFFTKMDPYAIITCRTQEQKSGAASGQGSEPEWNETFSFSVTDDVKELLIKIMDSDVGSDDDFVGEAKIPLEPLFMEGSLPPTAYRVVKNEEFHGEVKIGLTFTPEEECEERFSRREEEYEGRFSRPEEEYEERFSRREEEYGGWKDSSY